MLLDSLYWRTCSGSVPSCRALCVGLTTSFGSVHWAEGEKQPQPQDLHLQVPLEAACPGQTHPQRENQRGLARTEGQSGRPPQDGGPLPCGGVLHTGNDNLQSSCFQDTAAT